MKTSKTFVDDSKVSDHHAIIPTEESVPLTHMTNEERKIYDLVVRRFISVFYPASEYEQTTIKASVSGETFTAKGQVVLAAGWKAVYENLDLPDWKMILTVIFLITKKRKAVLSKSSPKLNGKAILFPYAGLSMTTGKTTPPARFTEGTLLSAMENPVKYMESKDAQARKTLGETGGLGTVATRADIIEKLFHSF